MSFLAEQAEKAFERSPRAGMAVLSAAIPRVLPVTRGLGLKVVQLDDEVCGVRLPFTKQAKNHVGGMYLGVLLIAAEVAMACYAMRVCRPDLFSTLVKSTESEFWRQSKAPVRAECRPGRVVRERLFACRDLEPGGKDAFPLVVDVLDDATDEAVGRVSFGVSIYRRPTAA